MENYFKISDFCIVSNDIPQDVADKILEFHLLPLNKVRYELGFPIWISKKSGYRPYKYELSKGRSGNSQHVFRGKGAVDLTCGNFTENKEKLFKALAEHSGYTRIAEYNSFFHCDYAHQIQNRWRFDARSGSWTRNYEFE